MIQKPRESFVFEDNVRHIARLLWPAAEYDGAAMVDGRERDGIFVSDDMVNLIECTLRTDKEKADQDADKLSKLSNKIRVKYPSRGIKAWFITAKEPTAEQREAVKKHAVRAAGALVAVSFDQFRQKLIDARAYLEARKDYRFGSIRDPETGGPSDATDFVQSDLIVDPGASTWTLTTLVENLTAGKKILLLGDYGAGKSMTVREVHRTLAKSFTNGSSNQFPITLNLRDHHGQTEATEALERHARKVAYASPSHLARAWRAGYAIPLLDGFDEIASAGWAGQAKKLRDIRYAAMQLLRDFVRDTPASSGILISGRAHFFDNDKELATALGIDAQFIKLRLSDFTEAQITSFLRNKGWDQSLPAWLPTRPLLLGYLASRNLLRETLEVDAGSAPAAAWHRLLDRISQREAEIEAGISGQSVRQIIERLASKARRSVDGVGPLTYDDIVSSFREVCGYSADDKGLVLLQRLPGLGVHNSDDGSRAFIDRDLAATASAGDVVGFVQDPFSDAPNEAAVWQSSLTPLGAEVAAFRCDESGLADSAQVAVALKQCGSVRGLDVLAADLVQLLAHGTRGYSEGIIYVSGVLIPELELTEVTPDISRIEFQDCVIGEIAIESNADPAYMPRFVRCYLAAVNGRVGYTDLPSGIFDDCLVDTFGDSTTTANDILSLGLPLGTTVMLTVLKKLYLQRGTGRKESALFRGLDHKEKDMVPNVLQLLRSEGFAIRARIREQTVWMPARAHTARVQRLLASPTASTDSLVAQSARLSSQ
jgi:hypothetical protein